MDFELIPSSDPDICDFEEKEALLWKQPTAESSKEDPEELEEIQNKPVSPPDEVWMVPPRFKSIEMYIKNIEESTNTFMILNKNEGKIELWGAPEDIEEAILRLNRLNDNKLDYVNERRKIEKREWANKNQEPAWGKPEKAPTTEKEKAKLKRREERKREEEKYKKKPEKSQKFPFNVYIVFPYTDMQASNVFGEKEVSLNPVRIETKCHIWYDKPPGSKGIITIVGNTKESIEDATTRVGHMFVKTFKERRVPENGWILHALKPLNKPHMIRITDPPSNFYKPYEKLPSGAHKYKLIEPVYEGERISTVKGTRDLNKSFDVNKLNRIYETAITKLRESFLEALEAVHLFDEEIKMRIRFGRTYLVTDYDFNDEIPIEKLTSNILSKSKFATCLASEEDQLKRLFETLSKSGQEFNDFPSREFKICAMRKSSDDKEETLPQCVFDVKFEKHLVKSTSNGKNNEKYEGKIGLCNAVIRQRNILDINMMSLDNYSWKLNIQTATRLSTETKSPQGKFLNKLRVCQQGRLVYSNTNEIRVISVCEKTKWKFWWNKNYVVEITRYEFWNLSRFMKRIGIEFPLSDERPPRISYGVTLYKMSWEDHFSYNCNLKVGEAPDWHPYEIVEEEVNLLDDIKSFLKVLQSNHPMQVN
ncbi:hypothetical protein RclHR1_02100016 [Rhizophagus clarus]|uniref:DUF7905 domain-containing protein n=1 Tax=Rhizophagus clarus TaxID=94130 RepID=A0A2Z6QSH2_9GLOM|nr:hypothetical protein RclHR1_02100016 [Rhizophagus clarus]